MQPSKILVAVLPALAFAEEGYSTSTCTSTATLTKTMTLSRVHNVTSHHNTTMTSAPTSVGTTPHFTSVPAVTTTGSGEETPTVTSGPDNAGSALDATRVMLAGAMGMVVVAML